MYVPAVQALFTCFTARFTPGGCDLVSRQPWVAVDTRCIVKMPGKRSALTSALNSSENVALSSCNTKRNSHSTPNGIATPSRVPQSSFPCLYTDAVKAGGEQVDDFATDLDPDALNFSRLSFSSVAADGRSRTYSRRHSLVRWQSTPGGQADLSAEMTDVQRVVLFIERQDVD